MAEFEGAVLIGSEISEYPRIDIINPEVSSMQHSTDIRPFWRGCVPRNASLGDFIVVRTCTYTNLGSTVYPTTRLGYIV